MENKAKMKQQEKNMGNKAKMKRIQVMCGHCGSTDVRRDADVAWNVEEQEWEVAAIYDNETCEDGGGETNLVECELND